MGTVPNPTTRVQNPPSRPRARVPAVEIGERAHDDVHLLLWQLRGGSRLLIDDAPLSLSADQAIWVPAGVRHAFTQERDSVLLPIFLDDARTATTLSEPRVVDVDDGLSLLLLARLQTQYTIIQPDADIERPILALLEERALTSPELPLPTSEAALAVAEALRFNPGDSRAVPELAASVHTAERTLQRAFLAETGMTLRQWRRRNRMAAAATLLRNAARLSAVAHRVGYTDDSAFRRAFRAHFGMAPSEYATTYQLRR